MNSMDDRGAEERVVLEQHPLQKNIFQGSKDASSSAWRTEFCKDVRIHGNKSYDWGPRETSRKSVIGEKKTNKTSIIKTVWGQM